MYFLILALPGKERQTKEAAGTGREEGDCDEKYDNHDYNNANNVHHDNERVNMFNFVGDSKRI